MKKTVALVVLRQLCCGLSSSLAGYHCICVQYFTQNKTLLIYCLYTIIKNLILFRITYQFIQRMNKADHMSSNCVTP